MYNAYQLIPDRTVDNKKGHEFARALHDLFSPWYRRLNIKKRNIETPERIWYVIRLRRGNISFHIVPTDTSETYVKQRLNRYWPHVTVNQKEIPDIPMVHTQTAELKYRRHNIFSLSSDWREDTVPISAILNVVRDMKEGDEARVIACVEPYSRTTWSDFSERSHEEFKQGKTPSRRGISGKLNVKTAAKVLDNTMEQVSDMVETLFESEDEAKAKDRSRKKRFRPDLEKREIMMDGKLDKATSTKRHEPVFKTHIFITSHSEDFSRRQITLRGLANAFGELSGDNELRRLEHKAASSRIISKLNQWNVPLDWDSNLMSATEVGKLFQLPTAQLQDDYADHLQTIEHRETDLPTRILTAGLKLGTVTYRGSIHDVYFPITDHDELCLPRIVIGGMGTGKTKGYGANFAVESIRNDFTVVTIDVAKDELGECIQAGAKSIGKSKKVIRLRFGKQILGLDWREALGSKYAVNRFAAEVLEFFNLHGHGAGVETARYIRLAAKTVAAGTGKLSDVFRLFADEKYRKSEVQRLESIGSEILVNQWKAYEELSQGMKGKVTEPVMNRLDMLLGDDYLQECLDSNESIDFRKWLNGGYAICCYVPKDELGAEATDIIVSILIAKVWLATLSRASESNPKPAFLVMDEPHQFMSSAKHWRSMVVESRKWRLGLVWLFHSWEQIPRDLAEIIKSAGPHYHLYTSSKKTYRDLAEEISPFTLEEAMKTPRYHAINVLRSGGVTVNPFIAKMTPPPK